MIYRLKMSSVERIKSRYSTFADWPLNDIEAIASLVRWARPQRRLTLIARHFDDLAVRHPRWVAWRRTWSRRRRGLTPHSSSGRCGVWPRCLPVSTLTSR